VEKRKLPGPSGIAVGNDISHRSRKISVYAALPWVEIESTAVGINRFLEVLDVAIAACSSLDRNELSVDAFGHAIRIPIGTKRHDIG
jgi:hypothetical protein